MKIAIVFDTATGRTEAAARAMGRSFEQRGHACTVRSIQGADPAALAEADLVCAGCWTHGLFIVLQRPTKDWLRFIERCDSLSGKKVVVFCTYRLATGRTLEKMARAVEQKGGEVVGRFEFRGPQPDDAFERFAAGL